MTWVLALFVYPLGPDLGHTADSVLHTARLHLASKAPSHHCGGRKRSGAGAGSPRITGDGRVPTGMGGVPPTNIKVEINRRDARVNAMETAALLEARGHARVPRITSVLHMPRALAAFRPARVDAVAAPSDYEALTPVPPPYRWIPDAGALVGPLPLRGSMSVCVFPVARMGVGHEPAGPVGYGTRRVGSPEACDSAMDCARSGLPLGASGV